jgi:hypothetical protein
MSNPILDTQGLPAFSRIKPEQVDWNRFLGDGVETRLFLVGAQVHLREIQIIQLARRLGAQAVKLFPGSSGGPSYLKALRGPFPDVPFVPTGGVSLENIADWFAAGAFALMARIDPVITIVLVFPLVIIAVLNRLLRGVVARIHRRARQLGAVVTAFIGETFAGVLAIKTAGAEEAVLERLREHNRRRRDAAVKDRLVMDVLDTATSATVEVSIGLVLLLAIPLAIALWVLASLAFNLYLSSDFNTYDKTYGSIGTVIVLLLYLYISSLTILFGGAWAIWRPWA